MQKTCNGCNGETTTTVPFIVLESERARSERTFQRMWVLVIVLVILLVGTNGAWLWYESQFETIETTIEAEQDGSGVNLVSGGDMFYGTEGQSDSPETRP